MQHRQESAELCSQQTASERVHYFEEACAEYAEEIPTAKPRIVRILSKYSIFCEKSRNPVENDQFFYFRLVKA